MKFGRYGREDSTLIMINKGTCFSCLWITRKSCTVKSSCTILFTMYFSVNKKATNSTEQHQINGGSKNLGFCVGGLLWVEGSWGGGGVYNFLFHNMVSNDEICCMQKLIFPVLTETELMVMTSLVCDIAFHIVKL